VLKLALMDTMVMSIPDNVNNVTLPVLPVTDL